jgi:RHS repeat-associated protein
MNGQTLQKAFCNLPGGGTAVFTSSGLAYYRHADWLGGSRFASTPSRTKYFDVAYAPYGEKYANSGTLDLNFTGQNQDTVLGLYDFMYREYHPVSGRWVQPDPAGMGAVSMTNPQTWNRYAYVGNMPLNNVDDLGLAPNDAGQYLRGQARTAALFSRFEFTLVDTGSGQVQGTNKNEGIICTTCNLYFVGSFSGQWFDLGETLPPPPANNGPKQNFSQCMAANSTTFSLAGLAARGRSGLFTPPRAG